MTGAAVDFVIKNDSRELGRLAEAVDDFSERNELPAETRFELQLCLEELVLNVVNHGFDNPGEHDIRVGIEVNDDAGRVLIVRVVDDGREFDPLTDTPAPDLDANLEDRAVGGLGVFLVRKIMDEVSYHREDGLNHLTLTKNL